MDRWKNLLAEERGLTPHLRRALVAVGIVAGLTLLVFGADRLTSSPFVCGSCHEIAPRAASWKVSPHVKVDCVACHVPPRPWYSFPETLYDRSRLLGRDIVKHFATASLGTVDSRPAGVAPMPDRICLRCHDPNRKATSGFRILIEHAAHARRNGSCVSCHITVAHPKPPRGVALSFMAQCFTCHGTAESPKAVAACGLCHPADFPLSPASHKSATWKRAHGQVALADARQCEMCHGRSFCDRCHGLPMPHPKGWARRGGHPANAKRDRRVCTRCHEDKPDMCSMCHHKAYDPARGTWVKQHFLEVQRRGAFFCLEECHSPVYCAGCHVSGAGPP